MLSVIKIVGITFLLIIIGAIVIGIVLGIRERLKDNEIIRNNERMKILKSQETLANIKAAQLESAENYTYQRSKTEQKKWDENVKKSKETQIYRKDLKPNNMNCDKYRFSGKYSKTGKMRTKREAFVFQGENPLQVIKEAGYEEPIEYVYEEWPEMSDKQKEVLYDRSGGKYQKNMSVGDASAMIERYLDHTFNADPGLFEYANTMRIPVSYYCTASRLSGILLHDLEGKDKIAFQIYCVYCKIKHDELKNLLIDPLKDKFYQYAEERLADKEYDILDSMYHGASGIKQKTKEWNVAKEFLIREGLIEDKKIRGK